MSSKYTKRHYQDMAGVLREERAEVDSAFGSMIIDSIESRMTALFKEDNPRFQPEKFARAARPSSGPPPALDFGEPEPPAGTYVVSWSVDARDEYQARFAREELEQAGVQVSEDGTVVGEIDPDELGLPDLETTGNLVSGSVSARYVASAAPGEGFTPGEPVEYRYGGVGNPAIPYGSWVRGTFGHYVSGTPSVYVLNGLGHRALRLASQVRRPRS